MPVKYWYDKERKYSQENNDIEKMQKGLQMCGPTASVMCIDSIGKLEYRYSSKGEYIPQPEDILSMAFYRYQKELQEIRSRVSQFPPNEIPQYYPFVVKKVFGVDSVFIGWNYEKDQITKEDFINKQIEKKTIDFKFIYRCLMNGYGVQLCLENPGHFISLVKEGDNVLYYNDPWSKREGLKNNGFLEELTRKEFETNIKKFAIIYL